MFRKFVSVMCLPHAALQQVKRIWRAVTGKFGKVYIGVGQGPIVWDHDQTKDRPVVGSPRREDHSEIEGDSTLRKDR